MDKVSTLSGYKVFVYTWVGFLSVFKYIVIEYACLNQAVNTISVERNNLWCPHFVQKFLYGFLMYYKFAH